MLLETLHIENFRSHKNTTINFQYGTTVIVGDNGSGKSTIIDAILFALSGEKWEKREGLRLDDFILWGKGGMSVFLTFSADGVKYKVKRGRILNRNTTAMLDIKNENGWKNIASGQKGVDKKLGEILNLNEIDTSVVKQGDLTRILKEKPSERKKYFHNLLGLGEMENFYRDFGKYVKDFEVKASEIIGKIGNEKEIRAKKEEKLKDIAVFREKGENLEKNREILEKELTEKKKLCREEEAKKDEYVKILGDISLIENSLKNVKNRIDEKEKELKNIEETEKEIPSLKEDAKNFEVLKVKKDKANEIVSLKGKYAIFKDKEKDYDEHILKISELRQTEKEYEKIYEEIENLKAKISELKIYLERVISLNEEEKETKRKIEECLTYIKDVEERYFTLFNEKCDIEKINKLPEKRENLRKEIDKLTNERENLKGKETELMARLKNLEQIKNTLLDKVNKERRNEGEIKRKIEECLTYIKDVEERYFTLFNEKCGIEKINKLPEKRENLRKEIDKLTNERENLKGEEQELRVMLKNLEKQKKELLEAKAVCPVCESPLSEDKKTSLMDNIDENKKNATDKLKDIMQEIKKIELNKSEKGKVLNDVESINNELFIAKYNELTVLNSKIEEIKKEILDAENEKSGCEKEERNINRESGEIKARIERIDAEKNERDKELLAVEGLRNELSLFINRNKEVTELNAGIEKIRKDKEGAEIKKKEYERHIDILAERTKIFDELKKKHDDYVYSKKFVEGTNIEEIRANAKKILNEINDIIRIHDIPCTIEDAEKWIANTKDQLSILEKRNDALHLYEERIKNKNEIENKRKEELLKEEELANKKKELEDKRKEIDYDEKRHIKNLKACEDAEKNYQEADKNLSIIHENIKNCENALGEIETDLKKIEETKREEEILNAFINFSKEIREKFGRNGIQKDISHSFFPILETYTNNLFSTFGFPYDGAEIFEDEENCNINLKKGKNAISSASLSGGEKSALSIALNAALSKIIGKADFLILDEPTESLDEGKVNELIEILKEFKGISQLIVISHDRDFKDAARSRIEIYKENGISHIVGGGNESEEYDYEGDEKGDRESQQGLF